MYYFGLNLESRFAVPGFWPEKGSTHTLPFERDEIRALDERLRGERLERRRRRLEREGALGVNGVEGEAERERERDSVVGIGGEQVVVVGRGVEGKGKVEGEGIGTFGVGSIERWARGRWRD